MDYRPEDREHSGEPRTPAPAPWERRPAGSIKETLETGEQLYTGAEGEAGYLADDQASLSSKLRGGGRDQGEHAGEEYTKLCPACRTVTGFVQGVCSSCNYRDGDPIPELPGGLDSYGGSGANPALIGGMIAAVAVVVLIILGFIYVPKLLNRQPATETPGATAAAPASTSDQEAAPAAQPVAVDDAGGFAGELDVVVIDEAFHTALSDALNTGSGAWASAGQDCYVYRYNVFENTVPATRQDVTVTAYLGGQDAAACAADPGDKPFRQALQSWIDAQNLHSGVSAIIRLDFDEKGSLPSDQDHYLRYGYWYGIDHWALLEPIVDGLEEIRKADGQYPDLLSEGLARGKLQTRGGIGFIANGVGYLPVFKTDGSGNIVMGTGKGIAAFMPEECNGYYLVMYLGTEKEGLDLFSPDDLKYYREKIQPFPYSPDAPVQNMPLTQDGEPDGIACIVKNGKLVD